MKVSEIQSLMARRFNNRTGMDADVLAELKIAQNTLEREFIHTRPWFLLSEFVGATTTAGEERLPLPSDFESEYEHGTLYVHDESLSDPWIELDKGVYDQLKAEYLGTGRPQKYSLVGKAFRLHPTPDDAYDICMLYYKHDTLLVDGNSENAWLQYVPKLVYSMAGVALALNFRDQGLEARFQSDFDTALEHFKVENIGRRMVNFTPDDEDQ